MDWLAGKIDNILVWIADMLEWLFVEKLIGGALDVFAEIIIDIPVPDFMSDISGYASTVANGPAGWIWSVLGISEGIAIISIAYGIRFLIRRLPVIG